MSSPELAPIHAAVRLRFDGPFHLGTGRAEGRTHRTVRRSANGTPYVPGSAIKGALRQSAERLARLVDGTLVDLGADLPERFGLRRRAGRVLQEPCRAPYPDHMCIGSNACILCRIFGNVATGARLLVSDAYPLVPPLEQQALERLHAPETDGDVAEEALATGRPGTLRTATVERITRVQMDRRRHAARAQALFTSEYARPLADFEFTLKGRLPLTAGTPETPAAELVLLAAAIRFTRQIGAERTTGRGQCALTCDMISAVDASYALPDLLGALDTIIFANL